MEASLDLESTVSQWVQRRYHYPQALAFCHHPNPRRLPMCNRAVVDEFTGGKSNISPEGLNPGGLEEDGVCPLELPSGLHSRQQHGDYRIHVRNYSSTWKASASLCLAAYSREHPLLMQGALGSSTVSHKHRAKSESRQSMSQRDKRKEKEGRKDNTWNLQAAREHTRLRQLQETQISQGPIGTRTHEWHQGRALSREDVQVLLLDGSLSYHLLMPSSWSVHL